MRILIMGPSSYFLDFLLSSIGIKSLNVGKTAVDTSVQAILDSDESVSLVLISLSCSLDNVETLNLERLTVIGVPERSSVKKKIFSLFGVERKSMTRELEHQTFDQILVHWIYEYALAVPRKLSTKTILVIHDAPIRVSYLAPSWMRLAKILMAIIVRIKLHNGKFVAVSRHTANLVSKELFFSRSIELLPNVMIQSSYSAVSQKKPFTILCIANDSKLKDIKSLIKVHVLLRNAFPKLLTRLVGPGLDSASKLAKNQSLVEGIEWMGVKSSNVLLNLIRESYIVVSCSKEESFGLTCLEALYLGTKFVTRNPLPSFLEIGNGNPLFVASTPESFSKDIVKTLQSAYDEISISESHAWIESKFGGTSYWDRLQALIHGN